MPITPVPQSGGKYGKLKTEPEKPVRKILKLDSFRLNNAVHAGTGTPGDSNDGQRKLPGVPEPSQAPPENKAPANLSSMKSLSKLGSRKELDKEDPRFGPCYAPDTELVTQYKTEMLKQVLCYGGGDELSMKNWYLNYIKNVDEEAKRAYDQKTVKQFKPKDFRELMLKDGCFFLQLALYILGCSEKLSYMEILPYCGANKDRETRKLIKAMFFVGNQIPFVVVSKLMELNFFRDLIKDKDWNNPPQELHKQALYYFVVQPALAGGKGQASASSGLTFPYLNGGMEIPGLKKPSDLLHCLYTLVLGDENDTVLDSTEEDPDFDLDDLESGIEMDRNNRFPCASEIKQKGIRIRKAGWGIRKIRFTKEYILMGCLYVPPFTFDGDSELMLMHLKNYEQVGQQQAAAGKHRSNKEVSAYLRFMRDLIQTPKDVDVLTSKQIITLTKGDIRDKLPGMLERMASSSAEEEVSFTQNLRLIRLKVMDYSSPNCYIISWALIFTLVQTVFTILQYFYPRN